MGDVRDVRDVRMRGFAERRDVEAVEFALRAEVDALPRTSEAVPLEAACGRVLAADIRSEVDVPGFDRAAMDGYAVRGADSFGAASYAPIPFELIGNAMPGQPFEGVVDAGQAVRIMTGAPLPEGADAVVMAEVCEEKAGRVEVSAAVPPRRHVGSVGEDIRRGEQVLRAGRRLRPQDVGLLASIGVADVPCLRRPGVALLVTGDELLAPGSRPAGYQIVDSNSPMLAALAARDGAHWLGRRHLSDRRDEIRDALAMSAADVLLVSGGSSVGQEDHAPGLVAELGELDFHGVAMRPSSPTGGGRIGATRVFLLPGNPVSCLCAYEFFAGPYVRALGGLPWAWPHRRVRVPLARKIASQIGRTDYVRVEISEGRAMPLATSGASILSSTVRASGAVIVPRRSEGLPEGSEVEVFLYDDGPLFQDACRGGSRSLPEAAS